MRKITSIAKRLGFEKKNLYCYGEEIAKIELDEKPLKKKSKLILVTAMTPTKAGEGKTTTSIGLTDGLNSVLRKEGKDEVAVCCLRQPSLGPFFGMKGGATGGGRATIIPDEKINIHFTGDIHALSSASLLISAIIDNSLYQGNPMNINPERIVFPRALDVNDRALRTIQVLGKKDETHEEEVVITAASELMTILCLAKDKNDFMKRLGNIILAYDVNDKPLYLKQFNIMNALWLILKDAYKPNLVQTLYGSPAFVHGGPFANIAHGCCSYRSLKAGLEHSSYCVTEAGFGADLGGEKFMDILCKANGLKPDATVVVGSIRAMKLQGGCSYEELSTENIDSALEGLKNLSRHLSNMKKFNVPVVVALNIFASDTKKEINAVKDALERNGYKVALFEAFAKGARGGEDLARLVLDTLKKEKAHYTPLYNGDESIKDVIELISKNIYGAEGVEYSSKAEEDIGIIEKLNPSPVYVCMAKTPLSFTDDPKIQGAPSGFKIHVSSVSYSSGANLVVVRTGALWLMPGLPKVPAAVKMEENK